MSFAQEYGSTNAFAAMLSWLEATLLGSFATAVAVIMVASIGLLLFLGRIPTRRAIETLFGCFIVFGASAIASGIMRSFHGSAGEPEVLATLPPPNIETAGPARTTPYDPYAGAALPPRR